MEWFNRNNLTINLDETKLMLFASKNMQKKATTIEMQGNNLQYGRQLNYLRVKLDSKVAFESLVSHKLYLVTKRRGSFVHKQQAPTIM